MPDWPSLTGGPVSFPDSNGDYRMQVQIIATKALFTQSCGVELPVWSIIGTAENLPAAADEIRRIFNGDSEMVANSDIILLENTTK